MSTDNPRQRRHYPAEFKMQPIQQVLYDNLTVSVLSRQHRINVTSFSDGSECGRHAALSPGSASLETRQLLCLLLSPAKR